MAAMFQRSDLAPQEAEPPVEHSSTTTRVSNGVLDATFVTRMIPDISPQGGIIGLCAVPHERAGMNDMGWHIADFLAFKALLRGETHPRGQTWLAQCDIASLAKANPDRYVHGKDRRVVAEASDASTNRDRAGNYQLRFDHIQVEPSPEILMTDFITTVTDKCHTARSRGYPLIIIICGPTTVEQDVIFGKPDSKFRLTSSQVRNLIGDDIETIFITPALFSAGWQVNPHFCRPAVAPVRASHVSLLAKQFGGIFAKDLVESFLGWKCPLLKVDLVDREEIEERFPGPAKPSTQQQETIEALRIKVHSALAARLSLEHGDHSFCFDTERDDWKNLVGPRRYVSLDHYRQKWESISVSSAIPRNEERLEFLGSAFGGTKSSQVNHIKHLIKESFESWPGYWTLPLGKIAKAKFQEFLRDPSPELHDCHETFNVMENRAAAGVMADMVIKYFALPKPYNERCKDWDELRWRAETSDAQQMVAIRPFREISKNIPGVNVPPQVNPDHLSAIQKRLEVPATYLSASLCIQYPESTQGMQVTVQRIQAFFQEIKLRQFGLLLADIEIIHKCMTWLEAIHMPIRPLDEAFEAAQIVQLPPSPERFWPHLQDAEEDVRKPTATPREGRGQGMSFENPDRLMKTNETSKLSASALEFSPSSEGFNIPAKPAGITRIPDLQTPSLVVTEHKPSPPLQQRTEQGDEEKPEAVPPRRGISPLQQSTAGTLMTPDKWAPPHLRKAEPDEEKAETKPSLIGTSHIHRSANKASSVRGETQTREFLTSGDNPKVPVTVRGETQTREFLTGGDNPKVPVKNDSWVPPHLRFAKKGVW